MQSLVVRRELDTLEMASTRAIAWAIGNLCRPLKPLLEWAACELRFGELMGVCLLAAAILAYLRLWIGCLIIVAIYLLALVFTSLLRSAISIAESDD